MTTSSDPLAFEPGAPPTAAEIREDHDPVEHRQRRHVLTWSTAAFTLMFAVWLMFGVLGIPIRDEFGLSDVQLSWLVSVAILNGSIWRLATGILADKFGGKVVTVVMLLMTAIPAYLVSTAGSYPALLFYAFLVGFAGNLFTVGIAWVSAWYPRQHQGFALGVFGAGNVGASVTKFIGPALIALVPAAGYLGGLIPGGWRFVPFLYAVLLVLMAGLTWFGTPKVDRKPGAGRPLSEMLRPLKQMRVWRFSLYYVIVFGAYVALSAWLPKYYVDVYDLPLQTAALLTALFIFPASLLRPLGGSLSDHFGARRVMYLTFGIILVASGILMMPYGHVVLYGPTGVEGEDSRSVLEWTPGVVIFTILVFLIACAMGIGKAAVYKHIPEYFPKDVGAVGGLVGALGALGGFFLPLAFAYTHAFSGAPQSTFGVLFLVTLIGAVWMHLTVLKIMHQRAPETRNQFEHHDDATGPDAPATPADADRVDVTTK
ncbi:MAG: nitrate/nitrite transporter [Candidatus Nanopelagicales bacterium]